MKFIKAFFSILLTIFLGISISVLAGLIMVRNIVNKEDIQKIINTKETSYIMSTNEVAYNTTDIENTEYDELESIANNSNIKPILSIIFSKTLLIGLIINCLIVTALIIIINMKLSSILIYLSLAILIHSGIFTLISGVLNLFKSDEILNSSIIKNAYTLINEQVASTILISFIIGFILMIIGIVLKNVKKEKQIN